VSRGFTDDHCAFGSQPPNDGCVVLREMVFVRAGSIGSYDIGGIDVVLEENRKAIELKGAAGSGIAEASGGHGLVLRDGGESVAKALTGLCFRKRERHQLG
jgi:hypothetical protein